MEKTLVSVNVPNFITINLMAFVGMLVIAALYQFIAKRNSGTGANNAGGY
jgi:hypothetical protein